MSASGCPYVYVLLHCQRLYNQSLHFASEIRNILCWFFMSHLFLNTEEQAFGCKSKTKIDVLMLKWMELCSSEC